MTNADIQEAFEYADKLKEILHPHEREHQFKVLAAAYRELETKCHRLQDITYKSLSSGLAVTLGDYFVELPDGYK